MALVCVDADGTGLVTELLPRKNALRRPPLANLDRLFIVCSAMEPAPNLRLLDLLAASAEIAGIDAVFLFTKSDLADCAPLVDIYTSAGFRAFALSPQREAGIAEVRALLRGCVSAFCGNTGVGKSTLLNRLLPELQLATGEISQKLGRGRHTTRHVELFPVADGWVADTPGFSALELENDAALTDRTLPLAFREFAPFLDACAFPDCAHMKESGCAVRAAAEAGRLPKSRYESYAALRGQWRRQYGKPRR
jgi:ribosome biogenesis GTPase